jgi:ACT domain-containing protein
MMMVADASKYTKSFERLGAALDRIGAEMGLKIRCQKSEIFEKMHRV